MKNKLISLIIVTFFLVLVINTISAQTNSIEKLRGAGFTEEELRLAFPEDIEYNDFDEGEELVAVERASIGDYINAWKFNLLVLSILIVLLIMIPKYAKNKRLKKILISGIMLLTVATLFSFFIDIRILIFVLAVMIFTGIIGAYIKKIKNKILISGIIATVPLLISSLLPFILRVPCPGFKYLLYVPGGLLICQILALLGWIALLSLVIAPAAYLVFMYFLVRKNKLSVGLLKWFISSNAYFFFIFLISWILVIEAGGGEAGMLFIFTIPYALVMIIITLIETIVVRRK